LEGLFIEFRDPLFGIIFFFIIIFIIAFLSYWWGRFKTKEEHRHLDRFLQQFQSLTPEEDLQELLGSEGMSENSWLLMAQTYHQHGDYEKAIEIYQALLERNPDAGRRKEILFLLGKTYVRAGFLERAKRVFLQILKHAPRSPEVLHYLMLVYEHLHEYHSALEVIEPLGELGSDIQMEQVYLECMALLHDRALSTDEKADKLISIYAQYHQLTYLIFDYLFTHRPALAWAHFDASQAERLSDVLWRLSPEVSDLDIISKHGYLRELFTAKGVVDLAQTSDTLEIDVLIKLQHAKQAENVTLTYEYICKKCKHIQPFAFHRCPNCNAIDTVINEPVLSKDYFEKNLSFQ
jgi:lipopolysaccharide biosynthesis regulator YciM